MVLAACSLSPAAAPVSGTLNMAPDELDLSNFTRATIVRDMIWPDDHGPHDDYLLEWWYYTGNVQDAAGRPFGYQLTVFRRAIAPPNTGTAPAESLSFDQIYFAHFAVSDIQAERQYAFERYSRGAGGLAGAQAKPFRAWVENWTIDGTPGAAAINAAGAVRMAAAQDGIALDLQLTPSKPLVLQADRGLSPKSATPGNASYYYSFTRLATQGSLTINGEKFDVTGSSWMDHEWSTSLLEEGAAGWDWLALQLGSDRELIVAQVRNKSGNPKDNFLGLAALIGPDGAPRNFKPDEVVFEPVAVWTSPQTRAAYPVQWRVAVPSVKLALEVRSRFDDQEADLSTIYYEGAVTASGQLDGAPITGVGYLEMTGYSASIGAQIR
jgi:predicted secreted hydrolase